MLRLLPCFASWRSKFGASYFPDPPPPAHLRQCSIVDLLNELAYNGEFRFEQGQGIQVLSEKETIHAKPLTLLNRRARVADLLLEMLHLFFKQRGQLLLGEDGLETPVLLCHCSLSLPNIRYQLSEIGYTEQR